MYVPVCIYQILASHEILNSAGQLSVQSMLEHPLIFFLIPLFFSIAHLCRKKKKNLYEISVAAVLNSAASCPQFHSLQISQISNVEKQRILTIEIRQPGFKRSYYLWSENNTILTEVIGALVRWFYLFLWE